MQSSLTSVSPFAVMQLTVGLVIGLTVDMSAAVTVSICSEGRTHISGRSVNISSPGYPASLPIRDNIICSCYVTTGSNSNANIRIQPTAIAFTSSSDACSATIDLWSSTERVDKKFCLNSPSNNFSDTVEFKSVYLTNITYKAFRPRVRSYRGNFLLSVTASRATYLLLICTSFSSTSTAAATQVISSTRRSTSTISSTIPSSSTTRISSTVRRRSTIPIRSTTPISSTVRRSSTTSIRTTTPISSTVRRSSTILISSTTPTSSAIPIVSTTPISSTVRRSSTIPISSTTPISSTVRRSSIIPISSTTPISSTVHRSSTIPISSTTPISSTIPISSTDRRSSTIPISSTTPLSSAIPMSSTTPLSSTNPISSTTPISSAIPSNIRYSSTTTMSRTTTSTSAKSGSTLEIMASTINPPVNASSSTEVFTTITAVQITYDDNLLWILIGVILPIALIAMIAITVIACRARKSKKQSVDIIMATLINNSYELRPSTNECTAEPSTPVSSQEGSPSTSRQQPNGQTKRQSSNYTPMKQKGPRTFSKTSLSTSVYTDIEEIESQHDSVFRGKAASPPVREKTCDNVYYNTATDAASAQLPRRSDISAYETCYSPEIEGVTSLDLVRFNSPANDVYSSIDEYANDVSDLPTGSQKGTVHGQDDETLYCNVAGQRGNYAVPRKTSGAEVTLVENQLYSS